MAQIKPIRAWRYNPELSARMDELTSPLFDVVSAKQRENLYKNPFNSIHLSVPAGPNGSATAARLLAQWKASGVLRQDALPAIYVYYQYFSLPGSQRTYCRKGFVCHVRAYDWSEHVMLRHENTMPGSVADRTQLLAATQLHVSPTHGLYTDPDFRLEQYMDESMQHPVYETEDYQGVRDVLSLIQDAEAIRAFVDTLRDKQIILADGHHRYESSLHYKHQQQARLHSQETGNEAYHFHLIYLTNTESDDLQILPTHRLLSELPDFDVSALLPKLETYFTVKAVEDPYALHEIISGKKWAFGLLTKQGAYKLRLKPEVFSTMEWKFPAVVKELDLTVMHYFIVEKALGIPGKVQRKSSHIHFSRSVSECLAQVTQGDAQLALITNGLSMDEVKQVCASGYTMPQKSTYFYPKVICGFLFSSIQPDESGLLFPCLEF